MLLHDDVISYSRLFIYHEFLHCAVRNDKNPPNIASEPFTEGTMHYFALK